TRRRIGASAICRVHIEPRLEDAPRVLSGTHGRSGLIPARHTARERARKPFGFPRWPGKPENLENPGKPERADTQKNDERTNGGRKDRSTDDVATPHVRWRRRSWFSS